MAEIIELNAEPAFLAAIIFGVPPNSTGSTAATVTDIRQNGRAVVQTVGGQVVIVQNPIKQYVSKSVLSRTLTLLHGYMRAGGGSASLACPASDVVRLDYNDALVSLLFSSPPDRIGSRLPNHNGSYSFNADVSAPQDDYEWTFVSRTPTSVVHTYGVLGGGDTTMTVIDFWELVIFYDDVQLVLTSHVQAILNLEQYPNVVTAALLHTITGDDGVTSTAIGVSGGVVGASSVFASSIKDLESEGSLNDSVSETRSNAQWALVGVDTSFMDAFGDPGETIVFDADFNPSVVTTFYGMVEDFMDDPTEPAAPSASLDVNYSVQFRFETDQPDAIAIDGTSAALLTAADPTLITEAGTVYDLRRKDPPEIPVGLFSSQIISIITKQR